MRAILFTLVLAIPVVGLGCASKRAKNVEDDWGSNFVANIENATRQAAGDERSIQGHQAMRDEEVKCNYAKRTRAELVEMKEKQEEKTAVDYIAGTSNNYWAMLPVPGAKMLGLMNKDQDELGLYNRAGCWTVSCVDEKIAITQKAVDEHCGVMANVPGPNALPDVSAGDGTTGD